MNNYRIAFFTADWNYELVESTLHGLKQYADDHPGVQICVFDCFGKDQDTPHDSSEYGIFRLPDLSQFDGLLIQGSQIVLDRIRGEIAGQIAESGIPALSIDCPVPGSALMSIDNRKAQHDVAEHVIRCHGARRLVYLTGLLDNGCPEGLYRRDGFISACQDNGLTDYEIIPCTWRTSDGAETAQRYIAEGLTLPDAFICANDEMALGMTEAFAEHGIRVPDDVIVTGFDYVTSSQLSSPRLTTLRRDYEKMNYQAVDRLVEIIRDGIDPDTRCYPFPFELIVSESCGCRQPEHSEALREKFFQQTRFLKNFYSIQDRMAKAIFEAPDLPALMRIFKEHSYVFGCGRAWFCVNDYYYDNYDKKQWKQDLRTFGDDIVMLDGDKTVRFPRQELLPPRIMDQYNFLVFYPLHYSVYNIGYLAMEGISEAAKLNLHESIISFLEIATENVRKKCLLRQFNHVLDNLYVHDALTGLYNRFGFERFGKEAYDRFLRQDGGALILFIDMDDMKIINDRFGHEAGDSAIISTAGILASSCSPDDFLMRFGGDEFLIIASVESLSLRDRIIQEVRRFNSSTSEPFRLSLSIGAVTSDSLDHLDLDEQVRMADARMYERKRIRKRMA